MAYTADDLARVRQAVLDLATGQRVTSFRTANGKTLSYADADIDKLRELEQTIAAQVASASHIGRRLRSRTRYTTTSKGL
ncbi:phage tail protein [Cobetia crustatorum]|uniref:Phage tail protein n=1 Tax=Cobetia crustatorum TaxID=553385 RepID=A0A558HG25_9GAMM|nr:phage tail protein [Cobetia crustatorum]TVU68070.1 phage tail protein [Cobetia crustatorum]